MDTKKKVQSTKDKVQSTADFPFSTVLAWYEKNGRHDLPWRQIYEKPLKERLYKVWIAEVMLQQTQVDRVIGYYTRFLGKYPTIESLASTSYDELFPYYQGLGYYGRARRMMELAKSVVEEYGGIFPDDFEKLRKLPGIGKYTAQALLAFGYDEPVLAMDANLQKIFARYYSGYRSEIISEKVIQQLETQLQKEHISGRAINNALMDFGALVSTSWDKIDRENYPLRDCVWFQTEGRIERRKKEEIKKNKDGLIKKVQTMPPGKRGGVTTLPTGRQDPLRVTGGENQVEGVGGIAKKGAKLVVFLHEAHKSYWSSTSSHYEPFLIEPTGSDDRRTVQDYFSATFDLEVSVRPSFGSGIFDGTPVKLFHAQIQTGTLKQKTFSKKEKEEWILKHLF